MATQIVHLDWAIKNILRDKANFGVLEGFLTALLEEDVKIIELLESESNQEYQRDKFNRVDLLVKGTDEVHYIIEVQTEYEYDYLERLLYGTSKTLIESIKLGEPYRNIKKIISVSILFYNLGRGNDYLYRGKTEFIGMTTNEKLNIKRKEMVDEINYKFVEKNIFPEYYLVQTRRFPDKVTKDIDEWIYSFKNNEVKDEFKSKHIELLREKLNILNMSPKERKKHENHVMSLVIEKDMIGSAYRKGFLAKEKETKIEIERAQEEKEKAQQEKEKALLREEKAQKEKEKAQEEKEKAQEEKEKLLDEKKESVVQMYKDGLPKNIISKYTGFSVEEIEIIIKGK